MKTELATVEDLSGLTLDDLKEMANTFGEKCQQAAKKTVQDAVTAGTALLAAKQQVQHGEWIKWLGANWDYSRRTAMTYMELASNVKRFTFEEAGSIRQAIGMIAAEKAETESPEVPRESRKPAKVKVSPVGQPPVQSEEVDDDPAPDPPTIRKTAAGSQKAKEADKPKTRPVVAEVLPDDSETLGWPATGSEQIHYVCDRYACQEILNMMVEITTGENAKRIAKMFRKAADKLDPPTKFARPDLEEVSAYFSELNATDPDSFFDFYESKGWLVGKVSMKDWRASARKWVRENQSNGKGNGNGHGKSTSNGRSRGLTAEDVFSAESLARGGKRG